MLRNLIVTNAQLLNKVVCCEHSRQNNSALFRQFVIREYECVGFGVCLWKQTQNSCKWKSNVK